MDKCRICNETIHDSKPTAVLHTKGSEVVNRVSAQRGSDFVTVPGERVHVTCRRNYCRADRIAPGISVEQQPQKKTMHSPI